MDQWDRMLQRTEPEALNQEPLEPELSEILRRYKKGEGLPMAPLPNFGVTGHHGTETMVGTRAAPPQTQGPKGLSGLSVPHLIPQ